MLCHGSATMEHTRVWWESSTLRTPEDEDAGMSDSDGVEAEDVAKNANAVSFILRGLCSGFGFG